jgi:para-nitrobenzyl esterase
MERRTFITSSALIGAGVLFDPWDSLLAQDIRGAAQSGIVKTTSGPIRGILTVAERKADAKQAPVYMYYFTWRSPVHDGKLKAYHTLDIPFVFENVDLATAMTGGRPERYALQDRMSVAWTTFARTGNPNVKGLLPEWPAFDTTQRATMVLNNECRVVNDPNGEERRALMAVRKQGGADNVD